jgi:hypothetical protein
VTETSGFSGGDDGIRIHDPLLANSIERLAANIVEHETAAQLTFWITPNDPE